MNRTSSRRDTGAPGRANVCCGDKRVPAPGAAFRRGACALLSALALVCGAAAAEKPNLIFILADDLGYGELGCYGQKVIQTPRLDRMAKEGLRFTHFYAGATVCAPSRPHRSA